MDHIKNLKVKKLRVLLHYHSVSEKFKKVPNKLDILEAVNEFLRKDWESIVKRTEGGVYVVINKAAHEDDE